MQIRLLMIISALLHLNGCKGGGDELSDYTCRACGEYDPIIEQRNEDAIAARCRVREAERNGGVTCTVGNVQYEQLILSFVECEEKPDCASASDSGQGGATALGWDYECHICGDESDVDSAFDGGLEDSGCEDGGILHGIGETCPGGATAVVLGFSNCNEAPACVGDE